MTIFDPTKRLSKEEIKRCIESGYASTLGQHIAFVEAERDAALARVARLEDVLRDIGKWFPKESSFRGGIAAVLAEQARAALSDQALGEEVP